MLREQEEKDKAYKDPVERAIEDIEKGEKDSEESEEERINIFQCSELVDYLVSLVEHQVAGSQSKFVFQLAMLNSVEGEFVQLGKNRSLLNFYQDEFAGERAQIYFS